MSPCSRTAAPVPGRGVAPIVTAPQKFRAACFTIEGLNSFALVIYFSYLYFFFRDQFGFHDRQNLELAALIGLTYAFFSLRAGRFAQRYGPFTALKIGFGVMLAGLLVGSQLVAVAGQIATACVVTIGMCFTWPVLEALVSEGDPADIPHVIGIYNITWASTNTLAFCIGGTLIEKLGYRSMFYVPLAAMVVQFALVFRLEKIHPPSRAAHAGPQAVTAGPGQPAPTRAKLFQRLAWLANPFAYIAINTLVAMLPGIARKFELSTMSAGFACSLWSFARFFTFVALWQWTGWHYRFRWLVTAFALLVLSFAAILIVPHLAAVLVAQLFFGSAVGLLYYSSLYYAMNASDTKSEHGGIHEAAIGVGNCLGPAVGATALWLAPQSTSGGAWAVSGLLTIGLGALVWLRLRPAKP